MAGSGVRPLTWKHSEVRQRAETAGPNAERLPILRMSARVERRLRDAPAEAGSIHSIFRRAVNVFWYDGSLVALQESGPLLAPFAVTLPRLPRAERLTPGGAVRRDREGVTVGGTRLDGTGATLVETALHPVQGDSSGLGGFLAILPAPTPAPGLDSPAGRLAQERLRAGIRDRDATAFLAGAYALVGLGEGLTPAGDDCLVGVLAVLRRFGGKAILGAPEVRRHLAQAAWTRTTLVGRDFLLHALDGEFSELILALFAASSIGERQEAVRQLAAVGGTSGADALRGIRLAAEELGS